MKKLISPMISGLVSALSLTTFDKLGYANYVSFVVAIIIGVIVSLVVSYIISKIKN